MGLREGGNEGESDEVEEHFRGTFEAKEMSWHCMGIKLVWNFEKEQLRLAY